MKSKTYLWLLGFFVIVIGALGLIGYKVVAIDPFFHYHLPDTEGYYYTLDNQRSQNDGIIRHFDYDAIITGTSMTENFKTTTMDALFGTTAIKVPFSGASFNEINDNMALAIEKNPDLKIIVRGLDMMKFFDDKDAMREDLGEFPTYLYDENIFNDVKYVFNRNVIFDRVYPMIRANDEPGFEPGITSFDAYSRWAYSFSYGVNTVLSEGEKFQGPGTPVLMSDKERETILASIRQNVTELAQAHPEVTFYCFFPPYSAVWWKLLVEKGSIYKQVEAERLVIEEILKCDNIKLFSFNNLTDITTDINNYKDISHYGIWINELLLKLMKEEKCLLTQENYEAYLDEELAFYSAYDYASLNAQEDYESDNYAGALLDEKYYGIEPYVLSDHLEDLAVLKNAVITQDAEDGGAVVECTGTLAREVGAKQKASAYVYETDDYVGMKIASVDITGYRYLAFDGQKVSANAQPGIYIYDEDGQVLEAFSKSYKKVGDQRHRYVLDISELSGKVTIVFNGGYIDRSGDEQSVYRFSHVTLY